jgi:hypothetical protein
MTGYAILGSTGNCGSALIQILLNRPTARIHAYCRNKAKLLQQFPDINSIGRVDIFEGRITDIQLLSSCIRGCRAVFLVASTNDNVPGCSVGQEAAVGVIKALENLESQGEQMPKLALLSSATIDDHLSRHIPYLLRQTLLFAASHVYNDLRETEKILRAEEPRLITIYIKPGALSVDRQRGYALSLTEEDGPLSYLDLAAGMIEAVDDEEGRYDMLNISVVNTRGKAKFPAGTPMCILAGLLRHFFPFLHPYLPSTGPR